MERVKLLAGRMEAHISGSCNNSERRIVKIQSKDTGSGGTYFGVVNGAVILLCHLLEQIFRVFFPGFIMHFFPLALIKKLSVFELQTGKTGV